MSTDKFMVIREFAEKVDHTGLAVGDLGNVLKGEYVERHVSRSPNQGGWSSWREFVKKARKRHGFLGEEEGRVRFDRGAHSGIHSYQEITFEDAHALAKAEAP